MLSRLFRKKQHAETPRKTPPDTPAAAPKPTHSSKPDGDQNSKPRGTNSGKKRRRGRGKSQSSAAAQAPSWDISMFAVEPSPDKTRFHDLNLRDEIMHAVYDLGFQYCSPIQSQILPMTLKGRDAIGKAQTGTGKTAAFLITIINDLLENSLDVERYIGEPRAVIVAPTRELAMQIADDAKKLCKYTDLHIVTLFGGADYTHQKNSVERAFVDIVVATPGRLIDFMQRGDLYLDRVECLVLDEADRMLDMGFIPQVKRIVRAMPDSNHRQTLLFSATYNQDVLNLAMRWTYDPVEVEIEPEHVATDTVAQTVYMVSGSDKLTVLFNLLREPDVGTAIVFVNRRGQANFLFERIKRHMRVKAGILSGDISQSVRTRTLKQFKDGELQVLIATDVAGRGIHVDDVTHVINYNLPENPEDYVHRIGRTGRAGATGISISLACEEDAFNLPAIEKYLGKKLDCTLPPEALLRRGQSSK